MNSKHLKDVKSDSRTPTTGHHSINIKKEDSEILRPMSYYIDDRLQLAKQIFSTLKPKTILNCAPDFLKSLDFEKIEERCLDELLGISKKRLSAAINSTRCPSNTDSSDDSAPEDFNDCISLEEISSDSSCTTNKYEPDSKKTTVLELIELQARARAIRSQLALEPVTKIEVDSEGSANSHQIYDNSSESDNNKSITDRGNGSGKRKVLSTVSKRIKTKIPETVISNNATLNINSQTISEENSSNSKTKFFQPTNLFYGPSEESPEFISKNCTDPLTKADIDLYENTNSKLNVKSIPKKKSLNRNFRNNHGEIESSNIYTADSDCDEKQNHNNKIRTLSTHLNKKEIKLRDRSSSEDVVTIIPSPKALSISDSSDDDFITKKSPIAIPEIENSERESPIHIPEFHNSVHKSDQEDGEILDESCESNNEIKSSDLKLDKKPPSDISESDNISKITDQICEIKDTTKSITIEIIEDKLLVNEENNEIDRKDGIIRSDNELEDDPNDDIISLEGGDLVNEMKEHLKENKPTKRRLKSKKHRSKKRTDKSSKDSTRNSIDIINLDDDSSTDDRQTIGKGEVTNK